MSRKKRVNYKDILILESLLVVVQLLFLAKDILFLGKHSLLKVLVILDDQSFLSELLNNMSWLLFFSSSTFLPAMLFYSSFMDVDVFQEIRTNERKKKFTTFVQRLYGYSFIYSMVYLILSVMLSQTIDGKIIVHMMLAWFGIGTLLWIGFVIYIIQESYLYVMVQFLFIVISFFAGEHSLFLVTREQDLISGMTVLAANVFVQISIIFSSRILYLRKEIY